MSPAVIPAGGENPKPAISDNFAGQYNTLLLRVQALERMVKSLSFLPQLNTTGLTNTDIDIAIFERSFAGSETQIVNGKIISDPVNGVLLIRQNGAWKKIE